MKARTTIATEINDSVTGSEAPPALRLADQVWIDELTTLQVLSSHGDLDADHRARAWIARDPDARRVWNTIAEACQQVPQGHTP